MSFDAKRSEPIRRGHSLRSLAFRLNLWYAGMFFLSMVLLVAVTLPMAAGALRSVDKVILESRLERHIAVLSQGLPTYQSAVEGSSALGESKAPVRVRDPHGRTLFQHGDFRTTTLVSERASGELSLEVGAGESPWQRALRSLRPAAAAALGMALVLALAGGVTLTHRGMRPVRELTAIAREVIRSGDLSRRVVERGTGDEFDQLSELFNRMLKRNQALVSGLREALDNVAHDLRTPLTRLRGTAEVALRLKDPDSAREALVLCIEESERVLVLLRGLMDISEADAGILRLDVQSVSLDQLAAQVLELYEDVAEEAGVSLTFQRGALVTVHADPGRLRQAIANLVDNALKYTPRGGHVAVTVQLEGTQARLDVRDDGEGIPTEALGRIFERLYRAEPSRSKPGLGLGLSLVQAIAKAHGGRVTVESSLGRGSFFALVLPATQSTPCE